MWIWIFSYISFGIVTVLFYRLTNFEEDFIDFEGSDPLEASEVFAVGDGRYRIVDA